MVLLQDTKLIDVTSKVFMFMKYIVRESQYNRLLSEDENKVKKYVRRRLPEIKKILYKRMEENDPNDYGDESEYVNAISSWTIVYLEDSNFNTMDEDELDEIVKEYFGKIISEYYYDNVNDDF